MSLCRLVNLGLELVINYVTSARGCVWGLHGLRMHSTSRFRRFRDRLSMQNDHFRNSRQANKSQTLDRGGGMAYPERLQVVGAR